MINVIYRIYQYIFNSENNFIYNDSIMISQDVMEVENKEDFKTAIKLIYGDKIKFRNTGKLENNELFVSIISYQCYNSKQYLKIHEYICPVCGKKFISNSYKEINLHNINYLKYINNDMYEKMKEEIENYVFCSTECMIKKYEEICKIFKEDCIKKDGFVNEYVSRNEFTNKGYIYMITKKSTNEFYVGQTNSIPMFRWVQHLKTNRFPIENICDYKFEVLEIVNKGNNILDRETYWINKKRNENKDKSLNVIVPKEKEFNLLEEKK